MVIYIDAICTRILMVNKVKNKNYFHSWDSFYAKSLDYPDTMTSIFRRCLYSRCWTIILWIRFDITSYWK